MLPACFRLEKLNSKWGFCVQILLSLYYRRGLGFGDCQNFVEEILGQKTAKLDNLGIFSQSLNNS